MRPTCRLTFATSAKSCRWRWLTRIDRLLLLTTRLGLPNSARQASSSPNATCALRDARVFAGGGIEPCVGRKWRDVHAGAR
jgi:hypothetical protein